MDKGAEQEKAAAEIMRMFRYFYQDEWAPEHLFDGKSRVWIQVFNNLVKEGLIKRRKKQFGFEYKWNAEFPDYY